MCTHKHTHTDNMNARNVFVNDAFAECDIFLIAIDTNAYLIKSYVTEI